MTRPAHHMLVPARSYQSSLIPMTGTEREVVSIEQARAVVINQPFTHDDCVSSSFEDYKANECWICRNSNDKWDLWLSCKHLFCEACSTEMLRRHMPCPL